MKLSKEDKKETAGDMFTECVKKAERFQNPHTKIAYYALRIFTIGCLYPLLAVFVGIIFTLVMIHLACIIYPPLGDIPHREYLGFQLFTLILGIVMTVIFLVFKEKRRKRRIEGHK